MSWRSYQHSQFLKLHLNSEKAPFWNDDDDEDDYDDDDESVPWNVLSDMALYKCCKWWWWWWWMTIMMMMMIVSVIDMLLLFSALTLIVNTYETWSNLIMQWIIYGVVSFISWRSNQHPQQAPEEWQGSQPEGSDSAPSQAVAKQGWGPRGNAHFSRVLHLSFYHHLPIWASNVQI